MRLQSEWISRDRLSDAIALEHLQAILDSLVAAANVGTTKLKLGQRTCHLPISHGPVVGGIVAIRRPQNPELLHRPVLPHRASLSTKGAAPLCCYIRVYWLIHLS